MNKNIAVKELTRRKLEKSLLTFTKYFFHLNGKKFIVNDHHEIICEHLEAVERGEISNLIINVPPRYSKTQLCLDWIARTIAKNKRASFLYLSGSDILVLKGSGYVKDLIETEAYQDLWPVSIKRDSKSKRLWLTDEGGGLYATSTGGQLLGFGAGSLVPHENFSGCIIIDDAHKPEDRGNSNIMSVHNERLNSAILSRRNGSKNTPVVIIMQRLHENDMSGFCLAGGTSIDFTHLKLPAIKEDGTALWHYKHTLEDLHEEKTANRFNFMSQYMQDPVPDDGIFFKNKWFKRYDIFDPEGKSDFSNAIFLGAHDGAVTEGAGDYTELGVVAVMPNKDIYVVDWYQAQESMHKWVAEKQEMAKKWRVIKWYSEAGTIRRASESYINDTMNRGYRYKMVWLPSNRSKIHNATAAVSASFQAMADAGKIYIPRCEWGDALIDQCLKFPNGKHDDKVDVMSFICIGVNDLGGGIETTQIKGFH